ATALLTRSQKRPVSLCYSRAMTSSIPTSSLHEPDCNGGLLPGIALPVHDGKMPRIAADDDRGGTARDQRGSAARRSRCQVCVCTVKRWYSANDRRRLKHPCVRLGDYRNEKE